MSGEAQKPATDGLVRPAATPMRMFVYGAALLLCGGVIGGVTGSLIALKVRDARIQRAIERPGQTGESVVRRLERDLHLNAEQRAAVEKVFEERSERTRSVRREFHETMRAEGEIMKREMAEILDPEQFERFEERFDRHRRRTPMDGGRKSHERTPSRPREGALPPPPPPE